MVMSKRLKWGLLCVGLLLCVIFPLSSAYADNSNCPVVSEEDVAAGTHTREQFQFSKYCRYNDRKAAPFSGGPYKASPPAGLYGKATDWPDNGADWKKAELFISGTSCPEMFDEDLSNDPSVNPETIKNNPNCSWDKFELTIRYDATRNDSISQVQKDFTAAGFSEGCPDNWNVGDSVTLPADAGPGNAGKQINPVCYANRTYTMGAGDRSTFFGSNNVIGTLLVEREADRLCVYALSGGMAEYFIDCRPSPPMPAAKAPDGECWVAEACYGDVAGADKATQWPFPMSSIAVRCVEETVSGIFKKAPPECVTERSTTMFESVQKNLRSAVMATLTLYIMFLGIKAALGQVQSHYEVMQAFIKILVVMYFAVSDGWLTYYPFLLGGMAQLAQMVFNYDASTGAILDQGGQVVRELTSFCYYDPSTYPSGKESLALWDSLDCRVFYYFGMTPEMPWFPKNFFLAIANIFSYNILIFLTLLIFGVMFLLIAVQAVRIYIVSIIAVTILVYVSPIFIPLVLFQPTRQFFQNWMDELVGYLLYPLVMFAFMALVLSLFDTLYWGEKALTNLDWNKDTGVLLVQNDGCLPDEEGHKSLGCLLQNAEVTAHTVPIIGVVIYMMANTQGQVMFVDLLKIVFFAILFYFFLQHIPNFIQSLTGTFRSASQVMPVGNPVKDGVNKVKDKMKSEKKKSNDEKGAKTSRQGGNTGGSDAKK
ncbi:MAG: hypothetical protein K0R63_1242 [Rickettsiales bacterium]|nr:hypothetical protein [Rickettsiales bacterium]